MNTKLKIAAFVGTAALLSACSSTSITPEDIVTSYSDGYNKIDTLAVGLVDPDTGTLLTTRTAEANIPSDGTVTYKGYIAGELDATGGIVGDLTLVADFETPSISGTAENFYHEVDGAYTGTLTATGGVLDAGAPGGTSQVSATLNGTLTNGETVNITSIGLEGQFLGADAEAIGGDAVGTVGAMLLLPGAFVAER